ncbi:phage tail protein [Bacillus seohaeanensis]|uniref:Phage tail protein n=1 Tax=Bacillus seohaeanensis TaxID=284580 RepID=A0ABW5RS24_9BACI
MLTITNNGVSEPLVDYNDFEITEELNGDFSISFTALNTELNEYAYPLLAEESLIEFEGHEYRVKKMKEIRNKKTVNYAPHIFFDLKGHRIYTINGGTKTLDEAVSFVLPDDWTFENVDVTESALLPNFGEDNAVALIRLICKAFQCEVKIEKGKHLVFKKQIGKDDDFQYRYKHNIKGLENDVNTEKLATVIKGIGANGLVVTYRSPNADIFGEIHAKEIKDDRYSVADSLIERIKRELIDYPEVSIEVEEVDLGEEKELGDKVWLIYEPLGIEFQTRIIATKKLPKRKGKNTATLGNRKKTFSDILTETRVEIDQNKKQFQSRIEQTNERITLEVEEIDESIASVNLRADNIELKVSDNEDNIASLNLRSDNIELSVSSLGGRMDSAESSISVNAGNISSKVSQTDYNGNTIASLINQSATTITLDAQKIEMLGITNVANELNIGKSFDDGTYKSINFRGDFGGVSISSPGIDTLNIDAINAITLDSTEIYMRGNVNFSNATVEGLSVSYASSAGNADTLDGYNSSAFSFSGHSHSEYASVYHSHGTDYVSSEYGQTIRLYRDNSTGNFILLHGSDRFRLSGTFY